MTQYVLFSDDYPFSADFDLLGLEADDQLVLISRRPTLVVNALQHSRVTRVLEVERFEAGEIIARMLCQMAVEVDAIALSHDDFVYATIADVVRHFGMRGMTRNGVEPFIDKAAAKHLLRSEGIAFPEFHIVDRNAGTVCDPRSGLSCAASDLPYPVFVKPRTGAGAEHACRIESCQEFEAWLSDRSFPHKFEVDEFVADAALFHCEVLLQAGKIAALQTCEYSFPCHTFAQGLPVGSYTMQMEAGGVGYDVAEFSRSCLEAMARQIDLPNGVVHLEAFRRSTGELLFLEAQLRPPGANAKELYAIHYGADIEAIHLRLQMERDVDQPRRIGPYAAWMYFPTKDGTVAGLSAIPPLRSLVRRCNWFVRVGQAIRRPTSILDAVGRGAVSLSVVISNDDYDELRADFRRLASFDPLVMT